jgi:proline iminopeptidase
VSHRYAETEPYERGLLEVGDGHRVYWEVCGNSAGKPAVVFHGGPGSGCSPSWRWLFDPEAYRLVLFDQRNSGRSTPHAHEPEVDLSANTTHHLVADAERLREHLGIERWLAMGGSWGSTLALAYAVANPERVTELVLFGVTTGRRAEFDWLFRGGLGETFFPVEWQRLVDSLPPAHGGGDVPAAYSTLLHDADPEVRRRAAEAWAYWESATPAWPPGEGLASRFEDPDFALGFARVVTHYVRHDAWLEDGALLAGAGVLRATPAVLLNGRFDFQAPLGNAWALERALPQAELVVVPDAGHSITEAFDRELVRATDRFRA